MGCSFETAKLQSLYDIKENLLTTTISSTPTKVSTRIVVSRNYNQKVGENQHGTKISHNSKKETSNKGCRDTSKITINKTIKKTTIQHSCDKNNAYSTSNTHSNNINNEQKKEAAYRPFKEVTNLREESKTNKITEKEVKEQSVQQKSTDKEREEILRVSCVNCYPLDCHSRICRQQASDRGIIKANANRNLKADKYSNISNCRYYHSKSSNQLQPLQRHYHYNPPHRHHYQYCQQQQKTLQNETEYEANFTKLSFRAKNDEMAANIAAIYNTGSQSLQQTLLQTCTTLTANANCIKNSVVQVWGHCTTIAESLLRGTKSQQYQRYARKPSEGAHRDFYQSKHKFKSEACSHLHKAIGSNKRHRNCNNNNYNKESNGKENVSNNPSQSHSSASAANTVSTTTTTTTSNINSNASATAAFNYIGHSHYHLLRNSINFYTASSKTHQHTSTHIQLYQTNLAIDWSKFDESSSDKEILDLLLEKKRYDKRLLPPVNGTLTVNVNVLLLSLASPDESSLKYEVEFLLHQQWNDPRLQYGNKSHYDFLNALHHHESIWTPDTYFIMHGDFKDPIIPMHFALRIYRNGTIMYAMRRHLILSCQGSLHIFPFDDPKCSFSMESISYEEAQIKYVWKNDETTLRKSPSLTTLNAYLIENKTTACDQNSWRGNYSCLRVDLIFTRDRAFYFTTVFIPGIILVTSSFITFWLEWNAVPARSMIGNYSCLQVELTFTRDRAYYFTTVFIPGIILVTSSFITFWLEWNAVPARVMIGVTTMLNFFTTSNGFRSTLPVVSNLTAMNVWDGVCMCFIYASLLEFVCVNYMGRKRPQHNVVYRPGENPVTQEVIEREFHAALHSEKAAAGFSGASGTATSRTNPVEHRSRAQMHQESSRGLLSKAVQNWQTLTLRRNKQECPEQQQQQSQQTEQITQRHTYEHTYYEPVRENAFTRATAITTTVTVEPEQKVITAIPSIVSSEISRLKRSHSMATNTPPLIFKGNIQDEESEAQKTSFDLKDISIELVERQIPLKPPRKKTSRSTSPSTSNYETINAAACCQSQQQPQQQSSSTVNRVSDC
uniref:Glutamate-gated chloride channel n=1 Tax=Glossina brevipalpis TaxID=37001 RepID=A0A1A9W510_9MUSC